MIVNSSQVSMNDLLNLCRELGHYAGGWRPCIGNRNIWHKDGQDFGIVNVIRISTRLPKISTDVTHEEILALAYELEDELESQGFNRYRTDDRKHAWKDENNEIIALKSNRLDALAEAIKYLIQKEENHVNRNV